MMANSFSMNIKIPQGYEHGGMFSPQYQQLNYQDIQSTIKVQKEEVIKVEHQEGMMEQPLADGGEVINVGTPDLPELNFNGFNSSDLNEEINESVLSDDIINHYDVSPMPALNLDPVQPSNSRLDIENLASGNVQFSISGGSQITHAVTTNDMNFESGDCCSKAQCCCCCDQQDINIMVNVDVNFNSSVAIGEGVDGADIDNAGTSFGDMLMTNSYGDLPTLTTTDPITLDLKTGHYDPDGAWQHQDLVYDLSSNQNEIYDSLPDDQVSMGHNMVLNNDISTGLDHLNTVIDYSSASANDVVSFDGHIDPNDIIVS